MLKLDMGNSFYERVYNIVKHVPKGKVTTYGHIAFLAGNPNAARAVGYALKAIPLELHEEIPWQRVISSKGKISISSRPHAANLQYELLKKEGIVFDSSGKTDLEKFGWLLK